MLPQNPWLEQHRPYRDPAQVMSPPQVPSVVVLRTPVAPGRGTTDRVTDTTGAAPDAVPSTQ